MKDEVRRLVANLAKLCNRKQSAGAAGELFARKWFEREGLEYFQLPQCQNTMPAELAKRGGKRPDFAVALNKSESAVYVDAKFHQTKDLTEFSLKVSELEKYKSFITWMHIGRESNEPVDDVLFMLFPKELNGDRFVWIHLDEFAKGTKTSLENEPALTVSLLDRAELWFDNCAKNGVVQGPLLKAVTDE